MVEKIKNKQEKQEKFSFGTFDDLEIILDKAIGIFQTRIETNMGSQFFYSEDNFILSLITRKKEHLLACLKEDSNSFAYRFETMGKEFYEEKVPYIDFIRAFSLLKELLIETVADEKEFQHMVKEIYFLAKRSLSFISKGYLLSMVNVDIHGIYVLLNKRDYNLSDEERSLNELLQWFYNLLLHVQSGEKKENLELIKCNTFMIFADVFNQYDKLEDDFSTKEYFEDMYKRLHIDAQSIVFYLDQDDYSGMLPVYSSLLNIYKMSLYITNRIQMVKRLQLMEAHISEQKILQLELEDSNKIWHAIMSATIDAIYVTDVKGNTISCNVAGANMFNLSISELLGKNIFSLMPIEVAENRQRLTSQVINTKQSIRFEDSRDGKYLNNTFYPVLDIQGEVEKLIVISSDLTEQKSAENDLKNSQQYLQAIIENEPECVKLVDDRGKLIEMNRAGLEMLQADSLEEAQQQPLINYILPKWRALFIALHKEVMNGNNGILEFEIKGLKGEFRWLETHAVPMHDSDGNANVLLGITRDITERKKKEEELVLIHNTHIKEIQKQEQLMFQQTRMAQMGEMISMIAHQWRQPLGAISSTSIDLGMKIEFDTFDLEEEKAREECKSYFTESLKDIDKYVQNLSTTIDDFRNFYKPNKQSDIVLVHETISKALNIIRVSFISDNIEIVEKYICYEKAKIYSNEIMQVILNILKNSQDNFKEKGIKNPKITITCKDSNDKVVIEICDNGGGIPDGTMNNIFDPYFSTKSEMNGTGLGLYMSKLIVEEHHNGQLLVNNCDDGVCFMIMLNKGIE